MPFIVQMSSVHVVVIGAFAPDMFHPLWFSKTGVLPDDDASALAVEVVSPDVTSLKSDWFTFTVQRMVPQAETLTLGSIKEPHVQLLDLSVRFLQQFSDVPVTALGINVARHYASPSPEAYHKVGERLLPPSVWGELVLKDGQRKGGMRTAMMELVRKGSSVAGVPVATVQPSLHVRDGVFIAINDHYDLGSLGQPADGASAVALVQERWGPALSLAEEVSVQVFGDIA